MVILVGSNAVLFNCSFFRKLLKIELFYFALVGEEVKSAAASTLSVQISAIDYK